MKKTISICASLFFLISCNTNNNSDQLSSTADLTDNSSIPIPTQVYESMENEKEFEENRENYFDLIHGNHPDWKAINAENFRLKEEKRAYMLKNRISESFADGNIEAEWIERGSVDVPGNIRICDYHPSTEDIYVISDGGILWKGNLDGETWETLNDGLQLSRDVMKVVDLPGGGLRIIAAVGSRLRYSEDLGETWEDATGLGSSTGRGIELIELNDADKTIVYLYQNSSVITGASNNKIAYSKDNGASFTFVTNLEASSSNFVSMDSPNGSEKAYVLDGKDKLYSFEDTELTLISDDLGLTGTRSMIQVNEVGGVRTFYSLMNSKSLFKSTDDGLSFDYVADLPTTAWAVGFQTSLDNPDILYYGDINLNRSSDGGETWSEVSIWWEYYSDVENKIHADIMAIEPFRKTDGEEFTLIPNHGGISVSYDEVVSTKNIALKDLNTGQFYDVLTSPQNPALIFGGTQDQGFQRTLTGDSPEPSSFEQVISGDYGQMQFTDNGKTIWIQFPGGAFQIYPNAETDDGPTFSFDVDGTDKPNVNWIIPTGSAPNPSDHFIYVGGGNLTGGSGSRLVKLELDGGSIVSSQSDFDFRATSGGNISAIETTPIDEDLLYVVTENGRFFHSEDAGETFEMTPSFVGPSGAWIFPADIYASRIDPDLVILGGSNIGGSAVHISRDGGETFDKLEGGESVNTMVHELVMDPQERFLFAASDAGPYVYDFEAEEWFDLLGTSAPIQQYISVEYIASEHIVRFATYGRGIWDLNISALAGIENEKSTTLFNVYPNPTIDKTIYIELGETSTVSLFDLKGNRIMQSVLNQGTNQINTTGLSKGVYVLSMQTKTGSTNTKKLIVK